MSNTERMTDDLPTRPGAVIGTIYYAYATGYVLGQDGLWRSIPDTMFPKRREDIVRLFPDWVILHSGRWSNTRKAFRIAHAWALAHGGPVFSVPSGRRLW